VKEKERLGLSRSVENRKMKVVRGRLLRIIFSARREEVAECWRRLHIEKTKN
jgi:hypothetical protein